MYTSVVISRVARWTTATGYLAIICRPVCCSSCSYHISLKTCQFQALAVFERPTQLQVFMSLQNWRRSKNFVPFFDLGNSFVT